MIDRHPITPPPELVQQWRAQALLYANNGVSREHWLTERAAQWGADQELEATLAEVSFLNSQALADRVRAARRPKPPSDKKQALEALSEMEDECLMVTHAATIRRALEALPDD